MIKTNLIKTASKVHDPSMHVKKADCSEIITRSKNKKEVP